MADSKQKVMMPSMVCISTETDKGRLAKVYGRFESAPYFTIYDSEKDTFVSHPMGVLDGKNIDIVICGGMGNDTLQKLNKTGIRVYIAASGTAGEIFEKYKQGKLEEIIVESSRTNLHCC